MQFEFRSGFNGYIHRCCALRTIGQSASVAYGFQSSGAKGKLRIGLGIIKTLAIKVPRMVGSPRGIRFKIDGIVNARNTCITDITLLGLQVLKRQADEKQYEGKLFNQTKN